MSKLDYPRRNPMFRTRAIDSLPVNVLPGAVLKHEPEKVDVSVAKRKVLEEQIATLMAKHAPATQPTARKAAKKSAKKAKKKAAR